MLQRKNQRVMSGAIEVDRPKLMQLHGVADCHSFNEPRFTEGSAARIGDILTCPTT